MSSTSFAVLAKARAKFGKRLSEKDYNSLLNSNSVAEVMSYLKSYTHYAEALRDINERDVHRGRLEVLLRQHLFYEFDSLCRYDSQMSTGFSAYVISRTEIEQIMRFLTLLNTSSTEKFIYQYPTYFAKHTEIDLQKLALARNYDEFLTILSNTKYSQIFEKYKPDENNLLPISDIENDLYTFVFSNLKKVIKSKTKGTERKELMELFTVINDYNNFSRVLRLKKYYNLTPEQIKNNLLYPFSSISEKTLDRMCRAESSGEVFSVMQETHTGKMIEQIGYVYASDISPRVKYKLARKNMYFSNNPSVVMISYMFVAETELMNIITLIEGTRYKLDSKKIQSLLIV